MPETSHKLLRVGSWILGLRELNKLTRLTSIDFERCLDSIAHLPHLDAVAGLRHLEASTFSSEAIAGNELTMFPDLAALYITSCDGCVTHIPLLLVACHSVHPGGFHASLCDAWKISQEWWHDDSSALPQQRDLESPVWLQMISSRRAISHQQD